MSRPAGVASSSGPWRWGRNRCAPHRAGGRPAWRWDLQSREPVREAEGVTVTTLARDSPGAEPLGQPDHTACVVASVPGSALGHPGTVSH